MGVAKLCLWGRWAGAEVQETPGLLFVGPLVPLGLAQGAGGAAAGKSKPSLLGCKPQRLLPLGTWRV